MRRLKNLPPEWRASESERELGDHVGDAGAAWFYAKKKTRHAAEQEREDFAAAHT
jgi:hypothetical protein